MDLAHRNVSYPNMDPRHALTFPLQIDVLCGLAPALNRWVVPRASMPYWRLWVNDRAGALVLWKGREIALEPGRCVVVAPHTHFEARLRHRIPSHVYAHFVLGGEWRRIHDEIWTVPLPAEARPLLATLRARLPDDSGPGVTEPWLTLALIAAVLSAAGPEAKPKPVPDARLRRTLAEIERDPGRAWSNAALAHTASLSEGGFARLFRQQIGVTPQAFLLQRRLEAARLALQHGDDPIEAIAERCGFCDRSYFTTVFSEEVGLAPAAYRKRARLEYKQ